MPLREDWVNGSTVNPADLNAIAAAVNELVETGGGGGGGVDDLGDLGVTATAAELNILDGATLSTTELNRVDGVTSPIQTQLDGKVDENSAITGATKTKITYDAKGLVTAGTDATTADIADSSNKRYVTDAQLTVIGNTSGTNTGDQTSIVGITGTKAQFNTAVSDGDIVYTDNSALTDTRTPTDGTVTTAKFAASALVTEAEGLGSSDNDTSVPTTAAVKDYVDDAVAGGSIPGLTASVSELNILDGATLTTTELNYVDGVTSAIQTQIDGKQASDTDLTDIAGLSPTNDDFIQRKAGAWTNRTPSQVKTDLSLTKSDVGLSNVTNNAQYYPGGTDVAVADGGTGVSTLTGIVKGNGTSAFSAASPGTDYVAPGGALGTPSSGTLTNCSGLPASGLVASTSQAVGFGTIELGHASDTTLSRSSAGNLAVEGNVVYRAGGTDVPVTDGGTGASDAAGARTNLGLVIGTNVQAYDADLDTWATKTAPSGTVVGNSDTQTLTNKRVTPRVGTTTSSATPSINTDDYDHYTITALAAAITSWTLSGTPTDGQKLIIRIKDNGSARALAWGSSFRAIGVTLPTTTVISKTLYVGLIWNSADSKWDVVAVAQEA